MKNLRNADRQEEKKDKKQDYRLLIMVKLYAYYKHVPN